MAIAALLFLTSCVNFVVNNYTESRVRVRIQTPDGGSYTKMINDGGAVESFSEHGGSYTITILPDERYKEMLHSLREEVSHRIFTQGANVFAQDVKRLSETLEAINEQLEALSSPAACSGTAPDFSSVTAVITRDFDTQEFDVACSVTTEGE